MSKSRSSAVAMVSGEQDGDALFFNVDANSAKEIPLLDAKANSFIVDMDRLFYFMVFWNFSVVM